MAGKPFMALAAKIVASIVVVAVMCAAAGVFGFRAGQADARYRFFGEVLSAGDRLPLVVNEAIGRTGSHALYGQDLWVLHHVYPGATKGFFVDLGSADGVADSNTNRLEAEGWRGICIDPFPSTMEGRTCRMFREVVDGEGGRTVQFQQPGSFSGGILEYAGWWIEDRDRKRTVELTTTTLADILERAGAPSFIDYMSVDIEGAEYEALRTFPFDTYRVGALTVEHNEDQERRVHIRRLLERHGYRLGRAVLDQDWCLLDDRQARMARGTVAEKRE